MKGLHLLHSTDTITVSFGIRLFVKDLDQNFSIIGVIRGLHHYFDPENFKPKGFQVSTLHMIFPLMAVPMA